jgi:hypothetical protein
MKQSLSRSVQFAYHVAKTSVAVQPNRLRALSKLRAQQQLWDTLAGASTLVASREGALKALAALFSRDRKPGDCFLFYGDVGVGKSTFRHDSPLQLAWRAWPHATCGTCSRAYIRSVAEDPFLQVPSPTFLLKNTYELEGACHSASGRVACAL